MTFLERVKDEPSVVIECWEELVAVVKAVDVLMDTDTLNNGAEIAELSTALEALDRKAGE